MKESDAPLVLALILVASLLLSPLLWGLALIVWAIWTEDGSTTFGLYIEPWEFVVVGVLTAISVALFVLASRVR